MKRIEPKIDAERRPDSNSSSGLGLESRVARRQRGSALLVTLMVTVILSLLGVAYLNMSDTENKISVNERDAKQTVYIAQLGAKMAVEWFNDPLPNASCTNCNSIAYLPTRAELTWNNIPAGGLPFYYKNGSTGSNVSGNIMFDRPFRGSPKDTLRGTETTPDVYVTDNTPTSTGNAYLRRINDMLNIEKVGGSPNTSATANMDLYGNTRITDLRVYAPPFLNGTRYGVGTVRATATKFEGYATTSQPISSRYVYITLNEIRFPAPTGPLTAKGSINFNGNVFVHWGEVLSYDSIDVQHVNNGNAPPLSIPWDDHITPANIGDFGSASGRTSSSSKWAALFGQDMQASLKYEDLWFRIRSAGEQIQFPSSGGVVPCTDLSGDVMPHPDSPPADKNTWQYRCESPDQRQMFPWDGSTAMAKDATRPTNQFRWDRTTIIPDIDYNTWKKVAQGRGKTLHYMVQANSNPAGSTCTGTGAATADCWQQNGAGISKNLLDWTNILGPGGNSVVGKQAGVWFFDTKNKANPQYPACTRSDTTCRANYLTPTFNYNGNQSMAPGGFVYINAVEFGVKGINRGTPPIVWPGETHNLAWKDVNPHFACTVGPCTVGADYYWIYAPCAANLTAAKTSACTGGAAPNVFDGHWVKNGTTLANGAVLNVPTSTRDTMDQVWYGSGTWNWVDNSAGGVIKGSGESVDFNPLEDVSMPFMNFVYDSATAGTCCDANQVKTITSIGKSATNAAHDPTSSGMTWGVDIDGPINPMDVDVYGIVFNEGDWGGAQGNNKIFGAMMFNGNYSSSGTTDVFFDERIIKSEWPPADWKIPRVKAASWKAE